jgi:hypothetical protein
MKRWRYLTIIGLLICIMVAWWSWQLNSGNPKYKGKRMSAWLESYDSSTEQERKATDEILRNMSTNAVPFLLRELGAYDSPLRLRLLRLLSRQSIIKFQYTNAAIRQERARRGILALRPVAKDVAPMLIAICDGRSPKVQAFLVLSTLGHMGPDARAAVPLLLRETTNTDAIIRQEAVWALGQIHAAPKSVVPVLITALRDPDGRVPALAARSLAHYGRDAQLAIPALLDLLEGKKRELKADPYSVTHREGRRLTHSAGLGTHPRPKPLCQY